MDFISTAKPQSAQSVSSDAALYDDGLRRHFSDIFSNMTVAMLISGIIAAFISSELLSLRAGESTMLPAGLITTMFSPPIFYVLAFAPLVVVLGAGFFVRTLSPSGSRAVLFVYAGLIGLSLGALISLFTTASVATAFFGSSIAFLGAAIVGYTTRANLAPMGAFLIMGVVGLIAASILNLFLASGALSFAVSSLAILIFSALTAWDMQRIKGSYLANRENPPAPATEALSLYINFVVIFQSILSIFGQQR